MKMETNPLNPVGVALYPANYETIEMVTDKGEEIVQQEFTEAQLFSHSIYELERLRMEKKNKKRRKVEHSDSDNKENQEKNQLEPQQEEDEEMKDVSSATPTIDEKFEDDNQDVKKEDEVEEDEEEEDVIDPRIHYRPIVAELQAGIAELHQLINSIDLIRRREFLEEMSCIRENTMPKKEDLEYLIESKSAQTKEASQILLSGVEALSSSVEKESVFFKGVTDLIGKWKICAPIHGNIPKPFRAGEPLAIDCSYVSAGSTYTPATRSITDLSCAELQRTEKGLVRVKQPEEFHPRTVKMEVRSLEMGAVGSYTLPPPQIKKMTRAQMDTLSTSVEDTEILRERNLSLLHAIQFAIFAEEIFQTVMKEALSPDANWTESAHSARNYMTKGIGNDGTSKRSQKKQKQGSKDVAESSVDGSDVSVVKVLDDEVELRVDDKHTLVVKLVDFRVCQEDKKCEKPTESQVDENAGKNYIDVIMKEEEEEEEDNNEQVDGVLPNGIHDVKMILANEKKVKALSLPPFDKEEFLSETCRYALILLQQEIRFRHGRNEISRGLLYTPVDESTTSTASFLVDNLTSESQTSSGALSKVVSIVAHNLLKEEIQNYLDDLSAKMAVQEADLPFTSGRILEDGSNQPLCDSVRGIFVTPRWKICPYDSTLSSFDLCIGKNFSTEVLIDGTIIRVEVGGTTLRELSGLQALKDFVETTICHQVAVALYLDTVSFGVSKSSLDLDKTRVRILSAGEWNGSCMGEGRVPENKSPGSIFLEPILNEELQLNISCMLESVNASSLTSFLKAEQPVSNKVQYVDWRRLVGDSDTSKLGFLLEQTSILLDAFTD